MKVVSNELQLPLPDRVEAAARAFAFVKVWNLLGPDCWICSLEDAMNALEKEGFSPVEAEAGIDWHRQGGRIRIVVPPSWSNEVSQARQISLETTPLWLQWLQEQDLNNGPVPPNRFRYGDKVIELPSRLYWLADCLWRSGVEKLRKQSFELLTDAVWQGEPVRDGSIRATASRLNKKFLEASIPITVATKSAHVTFSIDE